MNEQENKSLTSRYFRLLLFSLPLLALVVVIGARRIQAVPATLPVPVLKALQIIAPDVTITVDSVANLRDLDRGGLIKSIKVLGYSTPGDGGGGPIRIWKDKAAPGTYVDDGGAVIVPTGGDGSEAWVWADTDVVYVDDWGGNDASFSHAIAYAYANGGAEIKFKKATNYTFSKDYILPNNSTAKVSISGVEPCGTIINYTGRGTFLQLGDDTGYPTTNSGQIALTIKNLQIKTSTGVNGIYSEWRFNRGVKYENVKVEGFSGRGFWIKGKSWTALLINCISGRNDIGYEINSHACTLDHCDASGNKTYGLAVRRDTDRRYSVIPAGVTVNGGAYQQSNGAAIFLNGAQGFSFRGYIENGYRGSYTPAPGIKISSNPVNGQSAGVVGTQISGFINAGGYKNAIELDATAGSILGLSINGVDFVGRGLVYCVYVTGASIGGVTFLGNYYPGGGPKISNDLTKLALYSERVDNDITSAGTFTSNKVITGTAVFGNNRENQTITGYGQSVSPSYTNGNGELITVTTSDNFTINSIRQGQNGARMTIGIKNTSGGSMGTISWGAQYKMDGTWTNPANGYHKLVDFFYMDGKWQQLYTTSDLAN